MKYLFIIFLFLTLPANLFAQEVSDWISTEGKCIAANITTDEAKRRAVQRAKNEAIRQFVPEDITTEIVDIMSDGESGVNEAFSRVSRSTLSGLIVKERGYKEKWTEEMGYPMITVYLEVKVAKEEGRFDPNFKVTIKLDRTPAVYYDRAHSGSDAIHFKIEATQDCYLYVFNRMSNDMVQLVLPNPIIKNTEYLVNEDTQDYENMLKRISFQVQLPEGKESSMESLFVIALKEYYDILNDPDWSKVVEGNISTLGAMVEINNWLSGIPASERAETFASYQILKSNKN